MEKKDLNKKVLIVEDDEDFIFILEKKFSTEGFTVISAKNGESGISLAAEQKPDIILSDVLMPNMDGIAMANKIREVDAKVPIIFLTNIKDVDYTLEAQKSKDFEYIIKSDNSLDEIVTRTKKKLGI